MTRINCVPPSELTREHLIAEYRELPRTFKLAEAWYQRGGKPSELPPTYRLGTGHVTFFYDKLGYLYERQTALIAEMKRRGYTVNHDNPEELIEGKPPEILGNWTPTEAAQKENRARIAARLKGKGSS